MVTQFKFLNSNPGECFGTCNAQVGIVLNYCQYGVLNLGSWYNTGPYIIFPHFGNSNSGKLPGASTILFCCWVLFEGMLAHSETGGCNMMQKVNSFIK